MEFDNTEYEKSKLVTCQSEPKGAVQESLNKRIQESGFLFARVTHTAMEAQGQFGIPAAFPTELSDMICSYLQKDSLAKLRVTSQSCYKIATRHLFRELNVELTTRSLRNLVQISKRQDLGQHVVNLHYTGKLIFQETLHQFISYESNEDVADKCMDAEVSDYDDSDEDIFDKGEFEIERPSVNHIPPRTRPEGAPIPKDFFIERWKQYRKPRCKQERLLAMDQDVAVFKIALVRLPNLMHVSLNVPDVNRAIKIWRSYQDNIALSGATKDPLESAHLTRLESYDNSWELLQIHSINVAYGVTVFASLRHLTISFQASYATRIESLSTLQTQIQAFGTVLRAATRLETLCLHFGNPDQTPLYYAERQEEFIPVQFAHVVKDVTFHQLRELELASVTVAEAHFIEFLRRHAHSLTELRMRNMWLAEKTERWLYVFTEIQTTLNLKDLLVSSTWGGTDSGEQGSHLLLFLSRHYRPQGYPGPEELESFVLNRKLRSDPRPRDADEDEADPDKRRNRAAQTMAPLFEKYLI